MGGWKFLRPPGAARFGVSLERASHQGWTTEGGGRSRGRLSGPQLIVVRMGSWSARGGKSVATSEDNPRLSRALLAHTRSIMLGPRVGESGCNVRVRSWDSVQDRKGSAPGEGCAEDCHAGCRRLKSPAARQGQEGSDSPIRACRPWLSSTEPGGGIVNVDEKRSLSWGGNADGSDIPSGRAKGDRFCFQVWVFADICEGPRSGAPVLYWGELLEGRVVLR